MTWTPAPRDPRLIGNRIWLVPTADGPVLQKHYAPHGRGPAYWLRLLVERVARLKTPTSVRARWRTERELLACWRAANCDVPADLSATYPALAHGCTTLLEYVRGPLLGRLLASGRLSRVERDDLLQRFASAWGRRHALAIERSEARLVQEHGTMVHVIVGADGRLVTIDLEQAFLPRRDVRPLVAREVVAYVRSLAKGTEPATFRADLAAIVAGYPDAAVLRAAVDEYLHNPHWWRRTLWTLDRRVRRDRRRPLGKYGSLAALEAALAAA